MAKAAVDRRVERVVLQILVLNIAVAAAKGVYGWMSGSLAVASDALHSGLDAASNIVGFVALRLAARPPDDDHPYGHEKVEIVAAAVIGFVIAGGAVNFGIEAAKALIEGRPPPEVGAGGFVVMLGTLAVNLFVAWWERKKGRALDSPFLVADAAHTGSDVLVTIGVIIALIGAHFGITWADPVASLVVLAVVATVGVRIIRENVDVLIDRVALDAAELRTVALAVPGVLGCHRVRSRGIGGLLRVDLHVVLDGQITLERAHEITHEVETRIQARYPNAQDVVIHTEPSSAPED
ncbi:cation diffusion facilitator family transporter [Myxococcota bacterium]|nr:cation diffusion facilitator family transporter [Myxococcota bacterium]